MKLWSWFKSLGSIVVIGAIGVAVAMVLNGASARRQQKRANDGEEQMTALANDRTRAGIAKAAKLNKSIAKDKEKAAATRLNMEVQLEKISENDEMADIADRFNKRRLRDSTS